MIAYKGLHMKKTHIKKIKPNKSPTTKILGLGCRPADEI